MWVPAPMRAPSSTPVRRPTGDRTIGDGTSDCDLRPADGNDDTRGDDVPAGLPSRYQMFFPVPDQVGAAHPL